jgi:hypothetical protein
MSAPLDSAPGTLPDDAQKRLSAQVLSLVRAAYGEDAHFGLAVAKFGPSRTNNEAVGLAIYTAGSTSEPQQLAALFSLAAEQMGKAQVRLLAVDDGNPEGPKQ